MEVEGGERDRDTPTAVTTGLMCCAVAEGPADGPASADSAVTATGTVSPAVGGDVVLPPGGS